MSEIIQATSIRHEPIHKDFGHNYQSDFWGTFDEVVTKFRLSMATLKPPVSWAYLIDCKSGRIIVEYRAAKKDTFDPDVGYVKGHEEVFNYHPK